MSAGNVHGWCMGVQLHDAWVCSCMMHGCAAVARVPVLALPRFHRRPASHVPPVLC